MSCMYMSSFLAPTVRFELPNYSVDEYDESVEFAVVLSNPSSIDITVHVFTIDGSAAGKYP